MTQARWLSSFLWKFLSLAPAVGQGYSGTDSAASWSSLKMSIQHLFTISPCPTSQPGPHFGRGKKEKQLNPQAASPWWNSVIFLCLLSSYFTQVSVYSSIKWFLSRVSMCVCVFFFSNVCVFLSLAVWQVGSEFLNQGLNLCLLHWKLRVLTTEPPGKSCSGFYNTRVKQHMKTPGCTQASGCNNSHYWFFWHPSKDQSQLWWTTFPWFDGSNQGLCLGLGLCWKARRPIISTNAGSVYTICLGPCSNADSISSGVGSRVRPEVLHVYPNPRWGPCWGAKGGTLINKALAQWFSQ